MASHYLLLSSAIAFMILSSLICLLLVSIQNSIAVKKYYQTNQISDIETEDAEARSTSLSPVFATYDTQGYSIAS